MHLHRLPDLYDFDLKFRLEGKRNYYIVHKEVFKTKPMIGDRLEADRQTYLIESVGKLLQIDKDCYGIILKQVS